MLSMLQSTCLQTRFINKGKISLLNISHSFFLRSQCLVKMSIYKKNAELLTIERDSKLSDFFISHKNLTFYFSLAIKRFNSVVAGISLKLFLKNVSAHFLNKPLII